MNLQVDIGNSNIRWRFCRNNKVITSGAGKHSGCVEYDSIFDAIDFAPQCVQVVTVISHEVGRFEAWCTARWGVKPFFAEVDRKCAGVTNGYDDVMQMGADRWLAMIAAYNAAKHHCLVVDSGSACTVDLVLASGLHLGGYIVPGSQLMKDALFRDTDRVKLSSINYDANPRAGRTTEQAVASGLQLMLLGLVSIALDELLLAGAQSPVIYITGGGGEMLATLLQNYLSARNRLSEVGEIVLRPDLVFEGLPFVCA